ncbi:hypothetical protein ACX3U9_05680 [Corynebacterium pyruviciproducens]|uniref:Uncharacterized protein n=1 Tax=Corynebacterium pyruviciproducens TaxID=598660 RepID=A0AAF0YVK0_9CORY|nr:hypothetical protein [Corynebacterium pyruviciproducens]WOT02003.1 hypothetical protein CYJ47_12245 [Corynebacterium pyruviciproducens]
MTILQNGRVARTVQTGRTSMTYLPRRRTNMVVSNTNPREMTTSTIRKSWEMVGENVKKSMKDYSANS